IRHIRRWWRNHQAEIEDAVTEYLWKGPDSMARRMITVDANEAVASVAHRTSEVIVIYPITPSSPMAEWCDAWSANVVASKFFGGERITVQLDRDQKTIVFRMAIKKGLDQDQAAI